MLELGEESSRLHYQIGQELAKLSFRYLLALGEEAKFYVGGALKAGMAKERIFYLNAKNS